MCALERNPNIPNDVINIKTTTAVLKYPLIIVGGQVAPKLKKIMGHIEYIDEKTCLKCHLNEMQINFETRPVLAKKMPHEYRENCVSCHIIQK